MKYFVAGFLISFFVSTKVQLHNLDVEVKRQQEQINLLIEKSNSFENARPSCNFETQECQ